MKIARWGNSLAVRIPADVLAKAGWKLGDEIEATPGEGGLVLSRKDADADFLAAIRALREAAARTPDGARPFLTRDEANDR